jgi:3D-(3,5/4)-trihydroxycyclohexane-1,2-dione acylhydrolase (decyclizing)
MSPMPERLTVAQALVRFLANQYSERDGVRQRLIPGCFGIFGHGNVAGVGQALLQEQAVMPYYLARNEQGMVHAAAAFARHRNRLATLACSTSIGPGATNMVTGAALATINRLPVLLLPADTFATRAASPLLQELESPASYDVSVNDAFVPVSRFWDRINRPEQLLSSALAPTGSCPRPTRRPGGTSRSPRPPGPTRRAPRARATSATSARSARSSARKRR